MEPESEDGLNKMLAGFRLVTTANFHTCILYVSFDMVAMAKRAMAANGYVHVQELPWFKHNHNHEGCPYTLMPAIGEILLIGLSGATAGELDRTYITWDRNPEKRPNLLVCPTPAHRKTDVHGKVINLHEKPDCIISYLIPRLTVEGSTVLVCGSGAFGDILGIAACGRNAIGIEMDTVQFQATADLIPTLPLVNNAHQVTPIEELNVRLGAGTPLPEPEEGQVFCCRCNVAIKDMKEGGKCATCQEKALCKKCFHSFVNSAPKCSVCAACYEAANPASSSQSAPPITSSVSLSGA